MSKIVDIAQPNLMRHIFPTYRVPRISLAEGSLPVEVPRQAWCIDSTLGQGVLALNQPDPQQGTQLLTLLDRLDNQSGLLRRVEIRIEGEVGRDLLQLALQRQGRLSRIEATAVVTPSADAIRLLDGLGLREVGFDVPASDYQTHLGDSGSRTEQVRRLLGLIDMCVELHIQPRLDLVDVTRADLDGYLFPLVETCLEHLARHGSSQLRLRLCDTLGLGLPWPEAPVPRSVPRLLHTVRHALGLQPAQLEFLGANDLGLALANSFAAIICGCGAVVCSVGGIGERGGIAPLELMVIHLGGLVGADCDLTAVPLLLATLEPLGLTLGNHYPLWGEEALTTSHPPTTRQLDQAGELLVPFDTGRLVGRAPRVVVRPQSGPAGIAHLIRHELRIAEIQADDEAVRAIHKWVAQRGIKEIAWESIEAQVRERLPGLFDAPE